jgi:MFS family permease
MLGLMINGIIADRIGYKKTMIGALFFVNLGMSQLQDVFIDIADFFVAIFVVFFSKNIEVCRSMVHMRLC